MFLARTLASCTLAFRWFPRTLVATVLFLAALPASAQNQLWIRQLGASGPDGALAAAPDGSGGVYVSGGTQGSLGGQSAGSNDPWLARYDSAGNQTWIPVTPFPADAALLIAIELGSTNRGRPRPC